MGFASLGFDGGPSLTFRIDPTRMSGSFQTMISKGTCTFKGCTKTIKSKKLCGTHYERQRRHGSPDIVLKGGVKPGTLARERNPNWKGDEAGLDAQHKRIVRERGNPQSCTRCGTDDSEKYYHWAFNNTGDRNNIWDYERMCTGCHRSYDDEFVPRGSRHGNAKLTEEDIPRIFTMREEGHLLREIATEFSISIGTLSAVLDGKTWKHVERG